MGKTNNDSPPPRKRENASHFCVPRGRGVQWWWWCSWWWSSMRRNQHGRVTMQRSTRIMTTTAQHGRHLDRASAFPRTVTLDVRVRSLPVLLAAASHAMDAAGCYYQRGGGKGRIRRVLGGWGISGRDAHTLPRQCTHVDRYGARPRSHGPRRHARKYHDAPRESPHHVAVNQERCKSPAAPASLGPELSY